MVSDTGNRGEPASGYFLSALIFAGITALWAFIVREDPFYRFVDVGAVRLPLTTILYLLLAPFAGYMLGRWRYHLRHEGGAISFAGKLIARGVHFTYSHSLLVIFTVAMMTDYFLGLNLDKTIRSFDDQTFDIAARYAPWLAAYLTGFNLGRAIRSIRSRRIVAAQADTANFAEPGEPRSKGRKRGRDRAEPVLLLQDEAVKGDLALPEPAAAPSGSASLEAATPPPADEPGFLPPQDFDRLRPRLDQLR